MKNGNSKDDIIIKWSLFSLLPRVDIEFKEGYEEKVVDVFGKFQYRQWDKSNTFRHYKLPFRFHFWIVRQHYMRKLTKQ